MQSRPTMTEVKMPPGFPDGMSVVHPGGKDEAAKMEGFMAARHQAILTICKEKGWISSDEEFDSSKMSMEQLMEVRQDPRWKNPLGT